MMNLKQSNKYAVLLLIFSLLISCNPGTSSEKREQRAGKATGDIFIGIVHTSVSSNFFLEGINLAVEEINQRGGVLGRNIRTIIHDDMKDSRKGEEIAAELADNDAVVAVVGHGSSNTAIPASVIYEKAGMVFISYGAKDPDLTHYSGNFTFRNIPTQKNFGYEMANFSHVGKLKKTVVFHEREAAQKVLADIFKKEATALGIEIIATRSYFAWEMDFKEIIAQLKKEYEFDSIVIAGTMPAAAELVKELREMGISVPILGGDGLDSPDLWAIAGRAAEGIVLPTVFNPGDPNKLTRDFVKNFQSKYELPPDTWAAQGYDAMSLLAHAIEESGSTVPIIISSGLRFLENWKGVTGSYAFVPEGDITDKEIYFKKMKKGEFVFINEKQDYESDLFNYIEEFTLRLPLRQPISTLDPGFVTNQSDIEISELLFPALTGLESKTHKVVPELAKDWRLSRLSDDVYIFKMRHDVTWTNGEQVTAHDVLWAIQRNLNPATNSPNATDLYILKNAKAIHKGKIKDFKELGVYVPDDFTVIFKLEHPAPYFPALVNLPAFRPLPGSVIDKYKDRWSELDNIQICGPYRPILWQKEKGIFLKKNFRFYDAKKLSIPEIRYYVIPQRSVGLAMYENNELDIMGGNYLRLPSEELIRIKKGALKDEYHEDPHFCTYTYLFNIKQPPVDNPLVRKAISAAIDRQLLIDALNEGNGEPATSCTRPFLLNSTPVEEEIGIGFDPFQAREWLAQAGYPGGENFPEITILYEKSQFHKKVAQGVKALLQHHLNITVGLQGEEMEDYNRIVTKGVPSHIFRTKVCNDYPDADSTLRLFDPADPLYKTNWKNQEFSELIHNARSISDPKHRGRLYKRAEEILCKEETVAIPLYFEIDHSLVKPRVKGWSHMAVGGQLIHNWYFED